MVIDISNEDYREQFASDASGDYQLIDVREAEEYAAAHLPGAVNIPLSEFADRFEEVDEDAPALLVCNTGIRSLQAAYFLLSLGYEQLYNLEDGTKGWLRAGYAVESAGAPPSSSLKIKAE